MKAIVCEMCSSKDVVKDGDYFVCQNCGTKYTPESARKLMVEVEGKVDVSGSSVKVDTTDNVKRALENARRAKQKEDWEEAEKYYDLVERDEPGNIEAIFYSAYAKAKTTLTSDDVYRRQAVFKSFNNSISIVDDNFDTVKEAELRPLVDQMVADLIALAGSQFVYTVKKDGYGATVSDNSNVTYTLFRDAKCELISSLCNIAKKLKNAQNNSAAVHYCQNAKVLLKAITITERIEVSTGDWKAYYENEMKIIAELLSGIDNKAAMETYREIIASHDKKTQLITSKQKEEYDAFHRDIFSRMKKLDLTFDMDAEMEKANAYVAKGMKKNKISAMIAILLIILILGGTTALILHISNVF